MTENVAFKDVNQGAALGALPLTPLVIEGLEDFKGSFDRLCRRAGAVWTKSDQRPPDLKYTFNGRRGFFTTNFRQKLLYKRISRLIRFSFDAADGNSKF